MQKVKIPRTIDPVKIAKQRLTYDGIVTFDSFARLEQVVQEKVGEVQVKIHCDYDAQKRLVIYSNVKAPVTLTCQRCNGDIGLDLELDLAYAAVAAGKSSDHLPDYYEVVELNEEGEVNLHQLIEDELILAIPLVPMHEESLCRYSPEPISFGEIDEVEDKPNPFEILKQLKKDS
ncbi:23S rRNA accumulation protein YceD [Pseudoalteromonas tunicata]|nr:23S rRNA accumulation protein YceD [Pseudoalteromonas tunicata]AXT32626.1 23S rRNA accumulation protein YceD [Pseudoalteromonas tunicata]MDP4985799.1 23S rRNA accumulation protein YceD [Pseudoalteromonas tunicata]MDP5214108.1 23S rRNA accumulation protein YceD [Pseudoalteromonas tunicata]